MPSGFFVSKPSADTGLQHLNGWVVSNAVWIFLQEGKLPDRAL